MKNIKIINLVLGFLAFALGCIFIDYSYVVENIFLLRPLGYGFIGFAGHLAFGDIRSGDKNEN